MAREGPRGSADPLLGFRRMILDTWQRLQMRYPFQQDIGACADAGDAFRLDLEMRHMPLPEDLAFERLREKIPPKKDQPRVEATWREMFIAYRNWEIGRDALVTKWESVPEFSDDTAEEVLKSAEHEIREEFRAAVIALTSIPPSKDDLPGRRRLSRHLSPLEQWQFDEKRTREFFHQAEADYLANRLLYNRLLRKVLPETSDDDPLCSRLKLDERVLKLLEIAREYMGGDIELSNAHFLHVISFVLYENTLHYNSALGCAAASLHNGSVEEDMPHSDDYKADDIRKVLRILSNKITLEGLEVKSAEWSNIGGKDVTERVLGRPSPWWHLLLNEGSTKTFKQFPKMEHQPHDAFLVRLSTIGSESVQQVALIVKMLELARALGKAYPINPHVKRSMLAGTVTRLLAWGVHDHPREQYPLYNAFPNLIQVTLKQYEAFMEQHPRIALPSDNAYIKTLKGWASEFPIQPLPPEVQRVVEMFESSAASRMDMTSR